jgi:hypothetical protein
MGLLRDVRPATANARAIQHVLRTIDSQYRPGCIGIVRLACLIESKGNAGRHVMPDWLLPACLRWRSNLLTG